MKLYDAFMTIPVLLRELLVLGKEILDLLKEILSELTKIRESLFLFTETIKKLNVSRRSGLTKIKVRNLNGEEFDVDPDLWHTEINSTMFSTRTYNAFINNQVETIGEIAQKSRDDLLNVKNFGKISLREVEDFLQDQGLSVELKVVHSTILG